MGGAPAGVFMRQKVANGFNALEGLQQPDKHVGVIPVIAMLLFIISAVVGRTLYQTVASVPSRWDGAWRGSLAVAGTALAVAHCCEWQCQSLVESAEHEE